MRPTLARSGEGSQELISGLDPKGRRASSLQWDNLVVDIMLEHLDVGMGSPFDLLDGLARITTTNW
jgi:hypothetical protein